jgi:CRISPR-associated protein Csb1
MDAEGFYGDLRSAVALAGERAVLRVKATYQPAGGLGSKVFPPTYPSQDGRPYVIESRKVGGEKQEDVLLDSVPSQANRAEEALLRAVRAGVVELPLLELRHDGEAQVVLTSLEFPHRYADAYLRDSLLGGTKFDRSAIGQEMLAASLADAAGLYTYDPGSLVFGAWNSHRKGRQQKFPRVYVSEVVGWDPAVGARNVGRMDPLNLVGAARRGKDGQDWEYAPAGEKGKGERLSEIGHGNVAPNSQHGGVTITAA